MSELAVRPCQPEDRDLILAWRNHPTSRRFWENTEILAAEEHRRWFARKLESPVTTLLMAEREGVPTAFVRGEMVAEPGVVEIHVMVAPEARSKGSGTIAIDLASRMLLRHAARVRARVRRDNPASFGAFAKAGYVVIEGDERGFWLERGRVVAIHQPNYLPWAGFFDKMRASDYFVLLDSVSFSKNSYQNRCRIRAAGGAAWLTVPVMTAGRLGQVTSEVRMDRRGDWAARHWKTLEERYRHAPFFGEIRHALADVYAKDWDRLAELNVEVITRIAKALDITTPLVRATTLGVEGRRSELLCGLCRRLVATAYLSGPSGKNYLDTQPFAANGIAVRYHEFVERPYTAPDVAAIGGLSVIDAWAFRGTDR